MIDFGRAWDATRFTWDVRREMRALALSPLILGTDLTHLNATDLSLLEDTAVIAVDQDALDASRVAATSAAQIFVKKERHGGAGPRPSAATGRF